MGCQNSEHLGLKQGLGRYPSQPQMLPNPSCRHMYDHVRIYIYYIYLHPHTHMLYQHFCFLIPTLLVLCPNSNPQTAWGFPGESLESPVKWSPIAWFQNEIFLKIPLWKELTNLTTTIYPGSHWAKFSPLLSIGLFKYHPFWNQTISLIQQYSWLKHVEASIFVDLTLVELVPTNFHWLKKEILMV